ncbi:MAG: DUF6210 family protein [Cellvibrionaceae bacterium]
MKRVCLFNLEQVGVIYECSTQVMFFNRVGESMDGGFDFEIQAQQGLFIPLSNDAPEGFPSLMDCLRGFGGRLPSMAQLNDMLAQLSCSDLIAVDASRFGDSKWGWVYLTIIPSGEFSQFEGFGEGKAVMTWPVL